MLLRRSLITIFLVLFLDQLIKFWVKTHMYLGQEYPILGNWFIIHFTENEGMAFGMKFGGQYGKLLLSLFRIVAVSGIGWYLWTLIKANVKPLLVVCVSLIFAGAFGNIIDSAFYGLIFSDSWFTVANFMPPEGAYGTFLHGKVVDMFYFPLYSGIYPKWIPIWGGEDFQFFRPVFNMADASISCGVIILILFQTTLFEKHSGHQQEGTSLETEASVSSEADDSKESV
ncbi:MAG: lipoprotein signal peptidase [Bacteroidota bacterium]